MGFSKSFVTARPSAHLWRVPLNLSPYHSYIARPRALSSSVQLILFQNHPTTTPSPHGYHAAPSPQCLYLRFHLQSAASAPALETKLPQTQPTYYSQTGTPTFRLHHHPPPLSASAVVPRLNIAAPPANSTPRLFPYRLSRS